MSRRSSRPPCATRGLRSASPWPPPAATSPARARGTGACSRTPRIPGPLRPFEWCDRRSRTPHPHFLRQAPEAPWRRPESPGARRRRLHLDRTRAPERGSSAGTPSGSGRRPRGEPSSLSDRRRPGGRLQQSRSRPQGTRSRPRQAPAATLDSRFPFEEISFKPRHAGADDDHHGREYGHPREDTCGIEFSFSLGNDVTQAASGAQILSHNRPHHRESEARLQAREDPGERARQQHVTHQLPFAGAEHPNAVDDAAISVPHALIRVEEHDKEDEGHSQRHLRPDAEPEPQKEQGGEDNAWDGVQHRNIRIQHARRERRARQHEPERDADRCPDDQPEHSLLERHDQMPPERAVRHPERNPPGDVGRSAEKERVEQLERGARLPSRKDDGPEGKLGKRYGSPAETFFSHAPPRHADSSSLPLATPTTSSYRDR